MSNLKMRFRLNEVEFEIEGAEASVKQEFEKMKAFVINELIPNRSSSVKQISVPAPQESRAVKAIPVEPSGLPPIKETVEGIQPKSESDWILVFGLYASGNQQQNFSINDIRQYYRSTGRANTQRVNNIRNNMKTLLRKNLMADSGENEFALTIAGKKYAEQLLKGKQPSKFTAVKPAKRGRKPNVVQVAEKPLFKDMALTAEQLDGLLKFFRSKKPRTQQESILVLVKWAQDNLGAEAISIDELRYLMDKTMKKLPAAIGVILTQMRAGEEPLLAAAGRGRLAVSETGNTIVDAQLPVKSAVTKKLSKAAKK